MKKTILLLSFAMATAALSFGQFTFGPKVGYSASKLPNNFPAIKEQFKSNFQAGLFARMGNKAYVQPEAFFATRGGILENDSSGLEQAIKFKSIDVPVLFGFRFIDLKVVNIRVLLGPVASFTLKKEVEYDDMITDPIDPESLRNVIWAFDVGAGIDVWFVTFDFRYEFGLNNIYKAPGTSPVYDMKSSQFVFSLGFKLI